MRSFVLASTALMLIAAVASAGEVTVEGAHLCCGKCVTAAQKAFEGVEGISDVAVDKDAGKVTFKATDMKTVRQGLAALGKAGFAGKTSHDGKEIKGPKGFKEDAKADSVTIRGLHNCCGGCQKAITGALEGVKGVSGVDCKKKSCEVTGTGVSYSDLIAALHEAGLHGNIPAPKKAE